MPAVEADLKAALRVQAFELHTDAARSVTVAGYELESRT
jgi:hypothetical protein